jgi:hypothetical protein
MIDAKLFVYPQVALHRDIIRIIRDGWGGVRGISEKNKNTKCFSVETSRIEGLE